MRLEPKQMAEDKQDQDVHEDSKGAKIKRRVKRDEGGAKDD